MSHKISGAEVDALFHRVPETAQGKAFSQALAGHARRTIAGYGGGDVLRFVDPLAAAVVIEPGIVTQSLSASMDVALAPGIARGMTIVDPSGRLGTPRVTIVEQANLERVVDLYRRSIGL